MLKRSLICSAIALSSTLSGHAGAQAVPDAGQVLQQNAPPLPPPPSSAKPIPIELPKAGAAGVAGDVRVRLLSLVFTGNTVFDDAELGRALGGVLDKDYDLAGMRGLADAVSGFYRQRGYPFARAYIPEQEFRQGALRIDILEGRYGAVRASGGAELSAGADRFLAPLRPAGLIESGPLERAVLLIEDLPGIRVTPVMRPGVAVGSGDLTVGIEQTARFAGEIGIDNAGSRYTGRVQARAALSAYSLFLFGDKLTLDGLTTNEHMWLGGIDYEAPLGGSGLRGQIGYAYTSYTLAREFAHLDATGLARVFTARASYPLLRSQQTNLQLSAAYQHKALRDNYGITSTVDAKSSQTWPVMLRFDHRDALAGGGVSYGAVTWTPGRLRLTGALADVDAGTARKQGGFNKLNLDVARIQRLTDRLSIYGRYSGQWADKNLDSSERFGLGGYYGVRAYPLGEGIGDRGSLVQAELRYAVGPTVPYVFFDAGTVDVNAKAWDAGSAARRSIAGAGAGVRANHQGWSLDFSLAWRAHGGAPNASPDRGQPQAWVQAMFRF